MRSNYFDHPINVLGNTFQSNDEFIHYLSNVCERMIEFDSLLIFLTSMLIAIRIDDNRLRSRALLRCATPLLDAMLAQVSLI